MTDPFEERMRAWGSAARDDAPDVRMPRRRRLAPWIAVAASAAVVVAVVSLAVALKRDGSREPRRNSAPAASAPGGLPVGGPICPTRFDPAAKDGISNGWVPHPPSLGGRDRLLPSAPRATVVCRYDGHRLDGDPVGVGRASTDAIAADLNSAPSGDPGACRSYLARSDSENFLLRFEYPNDGLSWVSVPGNHCAGSTNGPFRSSRNVRLDAEQLYTTRRWTTEPSAIEVCSEPSNRGPDAGPVVVTGARAVTVCLREYADANAVRAYTYPGSGDDIAATVSRDPRFLAPVNCVVPRIGGTALLVFTYQHRREIRIAVTDSCANGTPAAGARADRYFGDIRSVVSGR